MTECSIQYEIEIDRYWGRMIVRKTRPVWEWERHLKWSAPATGDRCTMAVFIFDGTIGL